MNLEGLPRMLVIRRIVELKQECNPVRRFAGGD
jgi:hypothetical protein